MKDTKSSLPEIVKVLVKRDKISVKQAISRYLKMRKSVAKGKDPCIVLENYGLEPDYFMDLY